MINFREPCPAEKVLFRTEKRGLDYREVAVKNCLVPSQALLIRQNRR